VINDARNAVGIRRKSATSHISERRKMSSYTCRRSYPNRTLFAVSLLRIMCQKCNRFVACQGRL